MLALARNEGQSIIIDGNIEVKIVKWSRTSVRLAIQAPRKVTVDRDEVWRKMNPGKMTPLEVAEKERNERFTREGLVPGEIALRANVEGRWEPAAGLAAGTVVEAQGIVGVIEDAEGLKVNVTAHRRQVVVRVAVGAGEAVGAGQLLVVMRAE